MTNRTCSVPDCDRRHVAKGYCKKHYYSVHYQFPSTPCRVSGCPDRTDAHTGDGLCANHYARVRRHGDTNALIYGRRIGTTLADVLLERSEPWGDCVLWTGNLNDKMYAGYVLADDGRMVAAYRASYEQAHGPIAEGMTIDHLCHTNSPDCPRGNECKHRRCINPDHLEPVTQSENSLRLWARLS